MRTTILALVTSTTILCAAEAEPLIAIDFAAGTLAGVVDNTWKGAKPTLSLVDAADPVHGKELSIAVSPGGFAQVVLGRVALVADVRYAGSVRISADTDARVQFYLRKAGPPYTRFAGTTATVGREPTEVRFSGIASEACPDGRLMLYTETAVTLRVDDIRLESSAP